MGTESGDPKKLVGQKRRDFSGRFALNVWITLVFPQLHLHPSRFFWTTTQEWTLRLPRNHSHPTEALLLRPSSPDPFQWGGGGL